MGTTLLCSPFPIGDAFDNTSQETIRVRWPKEIPRFQPCKGWASVAVTDELAFLAFPKIGEGYGSDFGEYGGVLNFTQGIIGQVASALLERHAGICISIRGDR